MLASETGHPLDVFGCLAPSTLIFEAELSISIGTSGSTPC